MSPPNRALEVPGRWDLQRDKQDRLPIEPTGLVGLAAARETTSDRNSADLSLEKMIAAENLVGSPSKRTWIL
jgi:hypothetical protein